MKAASKKKGVSLMILMLMDLLLEGSQLLYVGDDDIISQAFGVTPKENEMFLPKIMSRKSRSSPTCPFFGVKKIILCIFGNR